MHVQIASTSDQARDLADGQSDLRQYGKRLIKYGIRAFTSVAGVLLASIVIGAFITTRSEESLDFIRVNKSIQITMCMICGLLFAFFGVALSWAGIQGSLRGSLKSGSVSGSISTASPGIVMMLCGTVLIGIATTREVTTRRSIPAGTEELVQKEAPGQEETEQAVKPDFSGM